MAFVACSSLFLLAAAVAVSGQHTAGSGEVYTHTAVLRENKYAVFWKYDSETITFEVEVETTGWVGFGLSPNGGMAGADIVIGGVNTDGSSYFTDRYATRNGMPSIDSEQNYELLHSSQSQTKTTLRFKRKLDTCDDNDMFITGDTYRLIWAYGTDDNIGYHSSTRGVKSMQLLGSTAPIPAMPNDTIQWDFLVENVNVPGDKDTTYWCKGFNVPSLPSKHHVIKFEPMITPGNEALVHHIVIYACYGDDVNTTGAHLYNAKSCGLMPNDLQPNCAATHFAWAIGAEPFYYPADVGLPFGDDEQPKFMLMELHYDNPAMATNLIDSSGLRITLTPTLRQYDAGLFVFGHGVTPMQVIPPNQESFKTYGYCSGECTKDGLASQPNGVKIFAGVLHSHLLGKKMNLRHIRNGVELEPVFKDNNYDFNYQEMITRREEKVILPGDDFILECELSSAGKDAFTYGGLATQNEMCMTFLLYYPRVGLSDCSNYPLSFVDYLNAAQIPNEYNSDYNTFIATSGEFAGLDQFTILNRTTWTAEKVKMLEQAQRDTTYYMRCANGPENLPASNRPFGTFKNGITVNKTYSPPARQCGATQPPATTPNPNAAVTSCGASFLAVVFAVLLHALRY